jgi:hypothetical protein
MDKIVTSYTTYIFSKEDILSALQGVYPELNGCHSYDMTLYENEIKSSIYIRKNHVRRFWC